MPVFLNNLDLSKNELRNARIQNLASDPGAPVLGQLYYNTGSNQLMLYTGSFVALSTGSVADATTTSKGILELAGDLTGTAATPLIQNHAVTAVKIASGTITDFEVAAANKDGTSGVASLRTIGTGALQAMAGNTTLSSIAAPGADVSLNTHKITNLVDPTNAQDAATKLYVDNAITGLDAKGSVLAATTGAETYTVAGGAVTVIAGTTLDGQSPGIGARILVKDAPSASGAGSANSNQPGNGIYTVTNATSNLTISRVTDMDAWSEVPSSYVWVESGTANADSGWVVTSDAGGTINSTAIQWVQFNGLGQILAGTGLTKTGNTINAIGTTNRISVAADSIDIDTAYAGQTSIITLGTITTGTWTGTTIAVANGGTGQITAKAARETGLGSVGYYSNAATHGAGTTITITQATHGLRSARALLVQVQDNSNGNVVYPDISVASSGDVTITFAASQSANTMQVTIVG